MAFLGLICPNKNTLEIKNTKEPTSFLNHQVKKPNEHYTLQNQYKNTKKKVGLKSQERRIIRN